MSATTQQHPFCAICGWYPSPRPGGPAYFTMAAMQEYIDLFWPARCMECDEPLPNDDADYARFYGEPAEQATRE